MEEKKRVMNRWIVVAVVLLGLFLLSFLTASFIGLFVNAETGNVALIKVHGPIVLSATGAFSKEATSDSIISLIDEAKKDSMIKAIILDIDSPGGSAVATDEIASAIKKSNKTTVAVMRDVGASGAYWVASSADHVIANRMTVTGSIGVISSYLEISGLLERYNVTYERLVAGQYKDMGTPFKEMTPAERSMMQSLLDEIQRDFIDAVAENRNMSKKDVEKIATGEIFTGRKAKELGLVDELGGIEEAKAYIEKNLNMTVEIKEFSKKVSFTEMLMGLNSQKSSLGLDTESSGVRV